MSTLHTQAAKLLFLIDILIKLSRLENGMIALHSEHGPLDPMLTQVGQQSTLAAQEKDLSLTVVPTDITACFDGKWTSEALCNLVDNAIKYTSGSVTISATAYEMLFGLMWQTLAVEFQRQNRPESFPTFTAPLTPPNRRAWGSASTWPGRF